MTTKEKRRITPVMGKQLFKHAKIRVAVRITPVMGKQPFFVDYGKNKKENNPRNGETTLRNVDITTSIF